MSFVYLISNVCCLFVSPVLYLLLSHAPTPCLLCFSVGSVTFLFLLCYLFYIVKNRSDSGAVF